MIATTHAMWEHSVNVPLENNLFRLGEHDGMPDAALFASSKVYLLFLSNNTLFFILISLFVSFLVFTVLVMRAHLHLWSLMLLWALQ